MLLDVIFGWEEGLKVVFSESLSPDFEAQFAARGLRPVAAVLGFFRLHTPDRLYRH